MSTGIDRLAAALADRYRLERELGAGGIVTVAAAQAAARRLPLKRRSARGQLAGARFGSPTQHLSRPSRLRGEELLPQRRKEREDEVAGCRLILDSRLSSLDSRLL
jgi:hypothetical protein